MADPAAQELIVPKKLANPVKENTTRRELHRELMFNQKVGKSVLNQKSELQRVMESKGLRYKASAVCTENNKLESESMKANNEFLNVHRRITAHNNHVDIHHQDS